MNKIVALIIHNLKKTKGQYFSFGFIICLTAFIMNIALVLAFQTFSAYDSRFDELDTADINFIIPSLQDDSEIIDEVGKINGVLEVERHDGVFVSATVREFADSDFDMNTVFYNLDDTRTINQLDVSEYQSKNENTVYIPLYMKELGGFAKDGDITYSVDGKDYTYTVGGIVSEMQYGNYGTGLIGGYFPSAAYEKFADAHKERVIAEYSLKVTDTADLLQIKNAITDILSDKGIAALNINDRDASKQTRTMVCTLLIVIFLALAVIILAVSIFLSSFRIRSTIEDELAQMGVLKAIGYTSNMIICSVTLPYTLVGIISSAIGTALSYAVLPFVAAVLAIQSGFTYTPVFDGVALLIVVAILVAAIVLFAYLSAVKIYKLNPMGAIRGSKGNGGAGQNILLSVLSIGIMVLLSFAGGLLYNVSIKPDNFMKTLSEEAPSVIFTVQDDKMPEITELLQKDSRVELILEYASVPLSYADGSLTAFVCEDFEKVTNDICYEGRNPADESEIAVGNMLADDYPIGSEIEITSSDKSAVYVVSGYTQSVNNAGKVCELTSEGYERIDGTINTVNVYLHEKEAEAFIEEYEEAHDSLIASSINYEQLNENGRTMYAGIVSVVVVALFIISVLMVLLVLYVIINSMITRRKQEFGIYKAIGYTSRQLTLMTAARFIPVVAVSSALAAVAGVWYLPVMNQFILSQIGAIKNYFEVSIWILLAFAVMFTAVSFLISVLLAAPIKKITAYSLLKE
ncbi:MAG: ABC transporter permease [Clostridium sp.]|nr:ABC transporter permease [Clostridium sp.]MCM1460076.1 ABC transporter permease [Bacteroides sp.]